VHFRKVLWLDDRMGMIRCLMIFRSMAVEVLEGLDVWMVGWLNSCMFVWFED